MFNTQILHLLRNEMDVVREFIFDELEHFNCKNTNLIFRFIY